MQFYARARDFVAMLRQWDVGWSGTTKVNQKLLLPTPVVAVEKKEEGEKFLFGLSALTSFFNTNPEATAETPGVHSSESHCG